MEGKTKMAKRNLRVRKASVSVSVGYLFALVYACIVRTLRPLGERLGGWESPGIGTYTSLLITLTQTCFRVSFLY